MIRMKPEIWALAQDDKLLRLLVEYAGAEQIELRTFSNVAEPLNRGQPAGGVILTIDSTTRFDNYMTIIKRFMKNFSFIDIVVFGEELPPRTLEKERRDGVDMYVTFPVDQDDFFVKMSHMVSMRELKSSAGIIGRSEELNEMLETVFQVAPTEVSVLIEGESGSGKEVTARAIHIMSKRRDKPFEAVNCGALAEGVLESELFGHERGSFTGAVSRRIGLFERTDKGTLFLDEVGEMSLSMQVRLLRVIENGEFLRVGGNEKVVADVRIIAATNRELESAVEMGSFRKDLYFRMKVVQVKIPPLRVRVDDIPLLIEYLIRKASKEHKKPVKGMEKRGIELLKKYSWPGNVRELANMIDSLTVLAKDRIIRADEVEKRLQASSAGATIPDLPVHVQKSKEDIERELILNSLLHLHNDVREILNILQGERGREIPSWGRWVEVSEKREKSTRDLKSIKFEAIKYALAANNGNRRKTARQLGISERTLYRRLRELRLE